MVVLKLLISEKIYDSLLERGAALCWSILDVMLLIVSDEGCWDSVDGSEVRRITGMLQATRTEKFLINCRMPRRREVAVQ